MSCASFVHARTVATPASLVPVPCEYLTIQYELTLKSYENRTNLVVPIKPRVVVVLQLRRTCEHCFIHLMGTLNCNGPLYTVSQKIILLDV